MYEPYSYKKDPSVPVFLDDRPIIVFDGFCVLCSHWARFVLRHDPKGNFRLLAAQSSLGQALYIHYGLDSVNYETNILLEKGAIYLKSEGCIHMAEGLGFPWSLAASLRIFPVKFRDHLYEWLAHNRFRIFGRRDTCFMTDQDYKDRFL